MKRLAASALLLVLMGATPRGGPEPTTPVAPAPTLLGAPQNVSADGSGEAQGRWFLPALVTDGGGSPATESGASSLPAVALRPTFGVDATELALVASVSLRGWATWYDVGPGHYAAAGPLLRDALGGAFRGQSVTVCHDGRCTVVRLTDVCACGERAGVPTLLDLSADAFRDLAPLSAGVIDVSIELGEAATLPPTGTAP